MRQLFLLRHGLAQAHSRTGDAGRPLMAKGRAQTQHVAAYLSAQNYRPAYALVSPAQRTMETFHVLDDALASVSQHNISMDQSARLYNAEPDIILDEIHSLDDKYESALIIGHNPGISEVALLLARANHTSAHEFMARGFSPSDMAIIDFDVAHWRDIKTDTGQLVDFMIAARIK